VRGAALLVALVLGGCAGAQTSGSEVTIPFVVADGVPVIPLAATEYVPSGAGPFPAIVLSHGSPGSPAARVHYPAKYPVASAVFKRWGFVVVNPVRRGYGKTGGGWAEGYGLCATPTFVEAGLETARDIAAAVAYVSRQPNVDPRRVVLVGQSAGGWGSLAAASRGDLPIRGVVNFAGGRGGRQQGIPHNNCDPDGLVAAAGTLGRTARVPTLWIYTENDQFFAPALSRRMVDAWRASGGPATYHLLPAIGRDGHALISMPDGVPLWSGKVEAFLREIGVLVR
jgi:dienelactone hydrolase